MGCGREEYALQAYSQPFHRHLSFFDNDQDDVIHYSDSVKGNLSIGLDFPVAVVMASGYHIIYGNGRSRLFGPLNPIIISKVSDRRSMLEGVTLDKSDGESLSRKELVNRAQTQGILDRAHVNGLWALAANSRGRLPAHDIQLYQQGTMLYELQRRRADNRDHVLPLMRGGPISVAGHSWFVGKLFGVKVYQIPQDKKSS